MSEISNTNPVTASTPAAAETGASPQAAAAGQTSGLTGSSNFTSLKAFKEKAPVVYQKMMEGIAMNICNDMKHHTDRLKEMWRKAREDQR